MSAYEASPKAIPNLAELRETYDFKGKQQVFPSVPVAPITLTISWGQIFAAISPFLLETPADSVVLFKLNEAIAAAFEKPLYSASLDEQSYQTIKVQLTALGLVDIRYLQSTTGAMALFWYLTPKGKNLMVRMRAIRSGAAGAQVPLPPGLPLVRGVYFD